MQENKETPERKRERLRQEELKRNPTGSLNVLLIGQTVAVLLI